MSLHPGEKLGTQQVPPPPELELELATELLATLLDTTLDATDDCALLTQQFRRWFPHQDARGTRQHSPRNARVAGS